MKRILVSVITAAAVLAPGTAWAHTAIPDGTVNLRSGPGTSYGIIGAITEPQTAHVLSHANGWLKVQTAGGTVGYMADWVTHDIYDDEVAFVQTTDSLTLRNGPSTQNQAIGSINRGERLRVLEGMGTWYKVDAGSRGQGWIMGEYTVPTSQPPATQSPTPPPEQPRPDLALAKGVLTTRRTVMYAGRDVRYNAVATVAAGTRLTYLTSLEGWVQVSNGTDRGWIPGQDLLLWDKDVTFQYQAGYSVQEDNWLIQYQRVREVNAWGDGLHLRATSDPGSAVLATLHVGDQMKLLAVPGGEYVQVMIASGQTGWVSRNYLRVVTGIPTDSIQLYKASDGVIRLEVAGPTGAVTGASDHKSLQIPLPPNANRQASLLIGEHEISGISVNSQGLTVRFDVPSSYQVMQQTDAGLVIEIKPVVQNVQLITGSDRLTYRLALSGETVVSAVREGGDVVMKLPGALIAGAPTLPAGLQLTSGYQGVTARVTTDRAFAIKKGAGYVDLVIYNPGLAGKTIVIDPGHGGSESGAVANDGYMEKDSTLATALKLKPLLEAMGAKVIMTRSADTRCASPAELASLPGDEQLRYDLACRAEVSNSNQADAYLSIHNNAGGSPLDNGTAVYWTDENLNASRSQVLANLVQQELVAALGRQDRGAIDDMYYVTKFSDSPSALAELAFITNPQEEALLKQDAFRQKAAEAMARALQRFFQ